MIVAYCRVSTDEKTTGQTTEAQKYSIEKYAKEQGLKIEKYYEDEGWSGSLLARPKLDELRADIKEEKITKILIYHPDRLARKQSYQFLLLDEFEKANIEVIFTALPDFFEGGKESLIVNKSVFSMIAELERVRISERFRLGKLRKVSQGQLITSQAPYGYKYLKGKKKFVFNEEELPTLKFILGWAKEGKSDNQTIKLLKQKGIKTRQGKDFWAKSTLNRILNTNLSVYSGSWFYNKYKMVVPKNPVKTGRYKRLESSRILNDKSEWIEVKLDPKLAVITEEEARLIRRKKRENQAVKKGHLKYKYLFQGKIFCGQCKGLNYCDNFHGTPFYRCANKHRNFPNPPTCIGGSIKSEKLETAVWDKLISFVTNPELVKKEAKRFIERSKQDSVISDTDLIELAKKRLLLEKEKEKLAEAYTKGIFDESDYLKQKERIALELDNLEGQEKEIALNKLKTNGIEPKALTQNITQLCEEVKGFLSDVKFEDKRKVLEWLAVKVYYFKGEYGLKGALSMDAKYSTMQLYARNSWKWKDNVGPCGTGDFADFNRRRGLGGNQNLFNYRVFICRSVNSYLKTF